MNSAISGTPMVIFFYIQRLLCLYDNLLCPIKYDILLEPSIEINSLNTIKWYSLSWDVSENTVYYNFNLLYSKEFQACLEELKLHSSKIIFMELGLFYKDDGHSNALIICKNSRGIMALRIDPHGPTTLEEFKPDLLDSQLNQIMEEHDILFIESKWWRLYNPLLNSALQYEDDFCSSWISFFIEELSLGLTKKNVDTIDLTTVLDIYITLLRDLDYKSLVSKYNLIYEHQSLNVPSKRPYMEFNLELLLLPETRKEFIGIYNTLFIQTFFCTIYELLVSCDSHLGQKTQLMDIESFYDTRVPSILEDISDILIEHIYKNLKVIAHISKKNNSFTSIFSLQGKGINYHQCKHLITHITDNLFD